MKSRLFLIALMALPACSPKQVVTAPVQAVGQAAGTVARTAAPVVAGAAVGAATANPAAGAAAGRAVSGRGNSTDAVTEAPATETEPQ